MGSFRALFASIGVSVSLVAAAALSLFAVSVVIAFGGWSTGMVEPAPRPALLLADSAPADAREATVAARPVVLRAPKRPRPRPVPASAAPSAPVAAPRAVVRRPVVSRPPAVTVAQVIAPAPDVAEPAPEPRSGDAVRRAGDELGSVVRDTGKGLGEITAPLSPPVSEAVQRLLDVVAAALQRTTDGVGGTLDVVGR